MAAMTRLPASSTKLSVVETPWPPLPSLSQLRPLMPPKTSLLALPEPMKMQRALLTMIARLTYCFIRLQPTEKTLANLATMTMTKITATQWGRLRDPLLKTLSPKSR